MDINFERKNLVPYEELKAGDIFVHAGELFIRSDSSTMNVMLLPSGKIKYLAHNNLKVEKVQATLTVRY